MCADNHSLLPFKDGVEPPTARSAACFSPGGGSTGVMPHMLARHSGDHVLSRAAVNRKPRGVVR